jgi:hypothetical protein
MARFSRKKADEVPDKHSDNAQRRTRPEDRGPLSPKVISDVYAKGRDRPDMAAGDHRDLQKPQDSIERRARDYDADVPLKGDRVWLRGGGAGHRPNMDRGKYDISDQPDRRAGGGGRNTASGRDMAASPFSAAHAARRDENDWNPNLKLKPIR